MAGDHSRAADAPGAPGAEVTAVERRFLGLHAGATDNRVYTRETSGSLQLPEGRDARLPVFSEAQRQLFCRAIARRTVEDGDHHVRIARLFSPPLATLDAFALMGAANARSPFVVDRIAREERSIFTRNSRARR